MKRAIAAIVGVAFVFASAGLAAAIVISGIGMALVGVFVATNFAEDNFTPVHMKRWRASVSILQRGAGLARPG